jgi:hypothetical protein
VSGRTSVKLSNGATALYLTLRREDTLESRESPEDSGQVKFGSNKEKSAAPQSAFAVAQETRANSGPWLRCGARRVDD